MLKVSAVVAFILMPSLAMAAVPLSTAPVESASSSRGPLEWPDVSAGQDLRLANVNFLLKQSQRNVAKCEKRRQKVMNKATVQARKGRPMTPATIEAEIARIQKVDGLRCARR